MKKTALITVAVIFCFMACTTKSAKRIVSISLSGINTNYFASDTLRPLYLRYPHRAYVALYAYNESADTIFMPIQQDGSLVKSVLQVAEGTYCRREREMEKEIIIPPCDSAFIYLIVEFLEEDTTRLANMMFNFPDFLDFRYTMAKSDSIFSKYALPDTVIFHVDKNIGLDFPDEEYVNDHIEWIL